MTGRRKAARHWIWTTIFCRIDWGMFACGYVSGGYSLRSLQMATEESDMDGSLW